MKRRILFFLFIACTSLSFANPLFSIGSKNGSAAEFALYPSHNDRFIAEFGGIACYHVGYSSADKHWPYALPGPLDGWGGGGFWSGFHPRHFPEIYFSLDKVSTKGECKLAINLCGANAHKVVTRMRIEINGHRFEKDIQGKDHSDILHSGVYANTYSLEFTIPSKWLNKGMNKIQLGLIKGSWVIFDSIELMSPKGFRLEKACSTLVKSVKPADFEYDMAGQRIQPLLIHLNLAEKKTLRFQTSDTTEVSRFIEQGETVQEIYLPSVKTSKNKTTKLRIYAEDKLFYETVVTRQQKPLHRYVDYVDLLMGTGNSRWMFKPASALPLSMVQIAPDNQNETWKAGYEYTIENISGFNHFCDWTMTGFIMQPTNGKLQVNPGAEDCPDEGYRSRIDKKSERAEVGYYGVYMTDTRIKAEVTSTRHAAMQRYTFPKSDQSRVLVDLFAPNEYPYNLVEAKVKKVSDTSVEGYVTYHDAFTGYSLVQDYTLYFVLQFNKPFTSMGGWTNDQIEEVKGYIYNWNRDHQFKSEPVIQENITEIKGKGDMGVFLNFKSEEGDEVLVRSGVSLVDIEGARNNLASEISRPFGWDFSGIVEHSKQVWEDYLQRVEIQTPDYNQKRKFYTNLYRSLAAKAIWSDADGRFVDENEKIVQLENPEDCIVSGEYWNTFWNNQQVFNLIAPEISEKWAKSAINLYKNSGWFNTDPAGIEHTGVMVAMHVVSQIMGAWQSGIHTFDLKTAYEGLKKMLTVAPEKYVGGGTVGVEDLVPYMKYGYIPSGMGHVSNTLEYSYDDWCLGQMAKVLGYDSDYEYFNKRSESWRAIFDPETGFMRPKDKSGNFTSPFDPYHTPGFVEGNSFSYSWFVPQHPEKLVEAVGKERFVSRLNEAFEKSAKSRFNAAGDNFASFPINHGNQISMQVAYLFNWAGAPELTQKWARGIQEKYYGFTPYDAYLGDEDLGQMSSWYIMSAIGLFQMNGGCSVNPYYELGSPRFEKITLNLKHLFGRGGQFVIEAKNASAENCYVQSVKLNGQPLKGFKIPQEKVLQGGKLEIVMGNKPL